MSGQMVILLNQIILLGELLWNILAVWVGLSRGRHFLLNIALSDNRINRLGLSYVKLMSRWVKLTLPNTQCAMQIEVIFPIYTESLACDEVCVSVFV